MTNLPYPVVSNSKPLLTVNVANINYLPDTIGETALYVTRVSSSPTPVEVRYPLSQRKNSTLYFILLNIGTSGRYSARLVYKGATLGITQFIFEAPTQITVTTESSNTVVYPRDTSEDDIRGWT